MKKESELRRKIKRSGFNKKDKCRLCKMKRTEDGHDPCIANLPGVIFACCGHGEDRGYLKFADGRCLYFKPLTMSLDIPQHEFVHVVPLFAANEAEREFHFKKGKVKTVIADMDPVEDAISFVRIRERRNH